LIKRLAVVGLVVFASALAAPPGAAIGPTKAQTVIATIAYPWATAGNQLSDTAMLSGYTSSATGTVTFTIYGPDDAFCAGTPIAAGVRTFNGNPFYDSDIMTLTAPGVYRWVVTYSGDASNEAAVSPCNAPGETSVVTQAPVVFKTQATPTAAAGGTIQDTAAVVFESGSATGTISFKLYGPDDLTCSGPATAAGARTVGLSNLYDSDPVIVAAAGTYRWIASYSGDLKNKSVTSVCNEPGETTVVTGTAPGAKAQPVLTTLALPSATAGNPLADTAILSGATSDATGTIAFSIYGPDDTLCAGTPIAAGTRTVAGNGFYNSDTVTLSDAGAYRWVAVYSGDANNNGTPFVCTTPGETSVVTKGTTVLSTLATPATSVGGSIQDTALLLFETGVATGTLTFSVYGPNDLVCAGPATAAGTRTVTGNTYYNSDVVTVPAIGTYHWVASYSGDLKNKSATSPCNAPGETSVVGP
jgi:hypothetical protein